MSAVAQAPVAAGVTRIGPNAITQVAAALDGQVGRAATARVFARAGLSQHLSQPPTDMVDDRDVVRLHRVLRAELGVPRARGVGAEAGRRTGDYLLAHRIPRPVQWVLKRLPARIAAQVLLTAIRRHAWTFTGAGAFTARMARRGDPVRLVIRHGPLARGDRADEPVCDFYAATFERLFRVLVHPDATVIETECEALGAPSCVFELRWRG
ncbi:MAG: bacteriochlorophyll 4-vinyl reductase [Burkholderiaceae bacterium]|nr:bacteriochlorophyll 4-vinyl reductase [Burkholderiaceae bacterium]